MTSKTQSCLHLTFIAFFVLVMLYASSLLKRIVTPQPLAAQQMGDINWLASMESSARNRTGFILELSSGDQSTGGAVNLLSLQCIAGQMHRDTVVVEPFITQGVWGVHPTGDLKEFTRENNVRLSDIYNIREWVGVTSSYGFAKLAKWEDFIWYAPRDVVLADFHFKESCSLPVLTERLSLLLQCNGFHVVRTTCLDFAKSGFLSIDQFKEQLYGELLPQTVSVIISVWNGNVRSLAADPYMNRYLISARKCARYKTGPLLTYVTNPSHRVLSDADTYIKKYLNHQTDYLSIVIRIEHSIIVFGISSAERTVRRCITRFTEAFHKMQNVNITKGVFFAMDFGKYGSDAFSINGKRGNSTKTEALMREFFHTVYGQSLTFDEWESSFETVSGFSNGGVGPYVAGMQKTIASHGRCLVAAGGGSFQRTMVDLYKKHKAQQNEDLCYIVLGKTCNVEELVLP